MIKRMALLACLVSQGFAITGGPNMPEYVQFEEVSANNLVDPNSGNFTYVVPLLEVPGPGGTYPLALNYHSGIKYNQEASWVGLGWALNVGAINRVLRGVPDDYFNSVMTTRNVKYLSGSSIGVNMGIGPMGLSLSWDANTGKFLGGSPYISLSTAMLPGFGAISSVASVGVTLTPGGVSVSAGGNLPVGTVSMGLYNSDNNSAGSDVSFSPGVSNKLNSSQGGAGHSVGMAAFHSGGSSNGTGAGEGYMTYETNGFGMSFDMVHIGVSETNWRYTLDESVVDYMNGFLFQDGTGNGFINRVPEAGAYYLASGTLPTTPRQRFERTKVGSMLLPSGDIYTVSANGLGGSFQPLIQPGKSVPVILDDAGANNEGYKINSPASIYDIAFRMDGDNGYNLLHDQGAVTGQLAGDDFNYAYGNATTMKQYGSTRIMPIFTKPAGSTSYQNILSGFIIVNADGMTYEYRQGVYTRMQADYAFPHATEAVESDRMEKVNGEKYANAWLLTAIKGADYLASNPSSLNPINGDYGHWVRFDYTTPSLVNWSAPYKGNAPPEDRIVGGGQTYYTRSYGIREQTFLSAIETQTHKAVFETVDRVDVPVSKNNPTNNPSGALDRMSFDDGLLSSRYDEGTGENGFQYNFPLRPAGGYPIQVQDPRDNVWQFDMHVKAGFTMTFPGDWGNAIQAYRDANCPGQGGCNVDASGIWEKIFGLHLKFTYVGEGNSKFNKDSKVFVGRTNLYGGDNDDNVYGFNVIFHCPEISVVAGDTKVKCTFDMVTGTTDQYPPDKSDILNLRIYSAFLNWPELERLGILDYSKRPQALSAIKLINKMQPSQVMKEIRFGYDYSLCKNLPGHPGIRDVEARYHDLGVYLSTDNATNTGKLTLKKVSVYGNGGFAAGQSAKLPDYVFGYQSGTGNPDYIGTYNQDIWGMFAPSANQTSRGVKQTNTATSGTPNGGEMVGVAWNLSRINLPTGGRIEVDYKRDEYYFAGLAKDPNTQKFIAFPDVFDLDMAKNSTSITWSQYYKLNVGSEDPTTFSFQNINLAANHPGNKNIPISSVGPDGKDDFAITAAGTSPIEPKDGELVLVAFVMEKALYNSNQFSTAFTGVMNIATVNRTDVSGQKRVRLIPLVQKDASNKFFYYQNFRHNVTGGGSYRFLHYLIPIRNNERRFYGGDVAVKSIKLFNGLTQQPLTKQYEYFATKVRDSQGNYVSGAAFPLSSGSTWTLPEMIDKDKYQRYWFAGTDRRYNLNFDPWPYFCMTDDKPNSGCGDPSGWVSVPQAPTKNIMTKFLDSTFEQESLPGVQYYPGAGITYSRPTETSVDGQGNKLGYTEYQFYNLAHNFVNNGAAYSQSLPTKNLEINDWVNSGVLVTAKLSAMNGKLMRRFEVNNADAILKRNEYEYATDVTAYKPPDGTAETVPLGSMQQRGGWKIGGATEQYVSVRVPVAHLVKDISIIDGVKNEVQSLAFDSRSGAALVTTKVNSDNKGVASYTVPAHWSNTQARTANRLNIPLEERTYAMPSGTSFDRSVLSRIIFARRNVWSTVPMRREWFDQPQSAHLYNIQSHVWSAPLGSDGLAMTPYTAPNASFAAPWAPERPKVTLTSLYGYPLEVRDDITGVYSATYTGHNTNLVTAVVQNAKWNEATVLTCDYTHPTNSQYFDSMTGWRKDIGGTVSLEPSSEDVGANVIKLVNTGSIFMNRIAIDPAKRRKYRASIRAKCQAGSLTLKLTPNVGPSVSLVYNDTWYRNVEQTIDLSLGDYIGVTGLTVEVKSSSGGTAYLQEVRVHPDDALVSSFFYDPVTYKLIGTLDENGQNRKFTYDALGRLTSKINHWGAVTETYQYKNMVNPQ